jgi:hypothetical protein
MKFIPYLLFLMACTPQEIKMADDFIQGEVNVAEKIIQDASGNPSPP